MKKVLIVLVLMLAAGSAWYLLRGAGTPEDPEEAGFVPLYNGKNLTGWRKIGGESSFEARGEDIVGIHGPGKNTFLRTEQTFADFTLRMQMRWDEPGNSGILFRAHQRGGDGRAFGYQYELDDSARAWTAGLYDEARRGWLADMKNNPEARAAVKLDDWNDIEIQAVGANLKTWINGTPAADIIDAFDSEGFVALQVHAGDKGIMRWRNIRIREEAAATVAGADLDELHFWRPDNINELVVEGRKVSGDVAAGASLVARRQFGDALVRFSLPVCEAPARVRFLHLSDSPGEASYAELSVSRGSASVTLHVGGEENVGEEQQVDVKSGLADVRLVALGDDLIVSVGEQDIARLTNTQLPERGEWQLFPSNCGGDLLVDNFHWVNLAASEAEVTFYKTLDTKPAPVLSPEQALAAFRIAPGFEVELVAAEPLVEDPVAMSWDEYGRLYVVELRGYMPDAYGTGRDEPVGQVVRLEDTDGDGRMDTSEVFLGALVNPRAVAVVNEGILIGEPPDLWLCSLPNRDAVCEDKVSLGIYGDGVGTASVEHLENRLLPGLDNWIYNAKSSRQLRLVDGDLQVREGLFRGQWGMDKDSVGRLFYNNNSNWVQGDLFAAEDLLAGKSTMPLPGLGEVFNESESVYTVRVNPGVNRAYLEGTLREDGRLNNTTGASGLAVYRGDQFPGRYRDHVFVPESAGNVVGQFALVEEGMQLSAQHQLYADEQWGQREFLGSTDERFRPVDARVGPDGALYIIDMYRGIIQDQHFLTDELREQIFQRELDAPLGRGRIWRIRHSQGREGYDFPALADNAPEALAAALSHGNGWVRDTAQRLLLSQRGQALAEIQSIALGGNEIGAIHALWTLAGRDELTRETALVSLFSGAHHRQVQALRSGADVLQLEDLLELADTRLHPAVAVQLAFGLALHSQDSEARAALIAGLDAAPGSPYLRQAVISAVSGAELDFIPEVLASSLLAEDSAVGREFIAALTHQAYRSLRGPLDNEELAPVMLLDLLALVQARDGDATWQQMAMLDGLNKLVREPGFRPAVLAAAPAIFSDTGIDDDNPLWEARLRGRRAFTWPGDEVAAGLKPLSPSQIAAMEKGQAFYPKCGTCHGPDGAGTTGLAPALAGVEWVTGPPEWLGRIILQGLAGPVSVNGETWQGVMPPHGHLAELDNATLAGLMTYMRRSWGNAADPVSESEAAAIREASVGRSSPWTVDELEQVPFDKGYERYVGKYAISFVTFTVAVVDRDLHLSVPMYGSGKMDDLGDGLFSASAGGEIIQLEFIDDEQGEVNELILYRGKEKIPVKRK